MTEEERKLNNAKAVMKWRVKNPNKYRAYQKEYKRKLRANAKDKDRPSGQENKSL